MTESRVRISEGPLLIHFFTGTKVDKLSPGALDVSYRRRKDNGRVFPTTRDKINALKERRRELDDARAETRAETDALLSDELVQELTTTGPIDPATFVDVDEDYDYDDDDTSDAIDDDAQPASETEPFVPMPLTPEEEAQAEAQRAKAREEGEVVIKLLELANRDMALTDEQEQISRKIRELSREEAATPTTDEVMNE
jgi:hypothetical protein